MGFDIPRDVSIKVVEDTPKSITVVIPNTPTKVKEISDVELERLAAGFTTSFCNPTGCGSICRGIC